MTKTSELLSQLASANRAYAAEQEAIDGYRAKIKTAEETVAAKIAEVESQKETIKLKRHEAKKCEGEISSLEKKLSDAQARQAQASTNDDYATWTQRIAEYTSRISEIEEQVLEMLEECDTAEVALDACDKEITASKDNFTVEKTDYLSSISSCEERAADLDARRTTLIEQLGPSFKGFYQRLFDKYAESTVVPIKKESCGGCYMKLSPDIIAQVRISDDPITCKSCNRILYSLAEK